MVSKPNPEDDNSMRRRMYASYQTQIPMWDDQSIHTFRGGCDVQGSGYDNKAYNAYGSPDNYFYMPIRYGGKVYRKKIYPGGKANSQTKGSSFVGDPNVQQLDEDWYNMAKYLIPMGVSIPKVMELFKNKYQGKYGGDLINDYINQDIKSFLNSAQRLGEHQYNN